MAKRVKKKNNAYSADRFTQGIREEDIVEYTKENVVRYGANVVLARSLPVIIDGLTPVRRKILYMMYHDENLLPNKPFKKVSQWLKRVSMYYAHGEGSVESTFESMIKDWETNGSLIDVSGNRGSVIGTRASANRYLEAKLSLYAYKCFFEEFDEDAVDMVPNYLQTLLEPAWLPSKYPNFLVSVAIGIAWGYSANLVPFSIQEAFELTKRIIREPNIDPKEIYLFPDSPRGYEIIDDGKAPIYCQQGRGTFTVRAKLKVEKLSNGEEVIDISGFPEGVTMDDTMRALAVLINDKEIFGIDYASDESDREHSHYHLHLKKGTDPKQVIAQLYASPATKLVGTCSIGFNFVSGMDIIDNISLEDAIRYWVERRVDYLQKYYVRRINDFEKKFHAYNGLLSVMTEDRFERASAIIRKAGDDDQMIDLLMKEFGLTSYQAEVVSNLSLRDNNQSRREKIRKDAEVIPMKLKQIEALIESRKTLEDKICRDLDEGIELFGRPRECQIIRKSRIKETKVYYRILVTQTSIKKIPAGNSSVGVVEDDVLGYYPEVTDDNRLIVINEAGLVYNVDFRKLKITESATKGYSLLDIAGVVGNATFSFLYGEDTVAKLKGINLYMFTARGFVKGTEIREYFGGKSVTQGIVLNEGDYVTGVYAANPSDHEYVLIYTPNGNAILQDMAEIDVTGRVTKGSRWLVFQDDDVVQGICPILQKRGQDVKICIVTRKGYVKISPLADIFVSKKRRSNMLSISRLVSGDSVYKIFQVGKDWGRKQIIGHMASGNKIHIECSTIKELPRLSKAEKRIPVPRGDSIVRVRLVDK